MPVTPENPIGPVKKDTIPVAKPKKKPKKK